MTQERERDYLDYFLIAVMLAAVMLALLAVFTDGVATSVAGVRISARTVFRPVIIAVVAAAIASWRSTHRRRQLADVWTRAERHATTIALCIAIFVFGIAMRTSSFQAHAADQWGYISQAALWARGDLVVEQPLAAEAPWPDATWSISPLGYRPGLRPATIVPTYPPGLPLMMAGFIKLFGSFGAFIVVPLLGSLAVLAAFFLGRRIGGPACGLLASMLLATSPIFLYQLREPMTDVPVTAWWLVATALVAAPSAASALAGGLAASAAIVTRPNLVPVAAILGGFVLVYSAPRVRTRIGYAACFAAGAMPGAIAVALINRSLYGSPFESGYGSTEELFKLEYLSANLSSYPRWLVETETPLILIAFAAPWVIRLPLTWLFLAIVATLSASYAFYVPFDNWTYLRFLLPAIALLFVLTSGVILVLSQRLPSSLSRWALAVLCFGVMAWRWDSAGMRPPHPNDRRFAVVGEFVRDELPQNAIVLSMQHSGSVRYYSGRSTLRWDLLDSQWLDRAVTFLQTKGYHPFVLLEEWEQPRFKEKFAGHTKLAALDWQPVATYPGDIRTDIFDLAHQSQTAVAATPKIISAR